MPDSDNPVKEVEETKVARTPVELSDAEYHSVADSYLENLLAHLERAQDEKPGVDAEFAVCHHPTLAQLREHTH